MFLVLFSTFLTLSSCLSRQYYFVDKNMTWTEAQRYCRQNYTDLATLENANNTKSLIAAALNSSYNGTAWIGLYDDVINGWRWFLDDDTLYGPGEKHFRNWSNIWNQEPNNLGGNEMYTQMYPQGSWNDWQCSALIYFVCYNKATNSHVLIKLTMTASDARQHCRQHYTDLAIIRSQSENQLITNLLESYSAWIGLYRTRQWSDQSNFSYQNWITGQPDNLGGVERCTAASLNNSGQWSDENCAKNLPFFCYKESSPTHKNVITIQLILTSQTDLTEPEMENILLQQLQKKIINKGLPRNIKLHLKK
ncbi:macrophage mannose receptor 1-like [Astyanax mexicanus]|uniref:Macrophage mannose receptor 1-like n=1 Tax=Astyanax mexicanus TaxID=7994 RepID=A0A8T2LX04_ASTMX|nr:macrophage mannose receptor 1-like [Astyanax mexicanus]